MVVAGRRAGGVGVEEAVDGIGEVRLEEVLRELVAVEASLASGDNL